MKDNFQKNSEPQKVAEPTVGRIVLYYERADAVAFPAMVSAVVPGSLRITTAHAFLHDGIRIVSDLPHRSDLGVGMNNESWDWMPFQKGQAAKTEELERKLAGAVGGPVNLTPGQNKPHHPKGDPRNDTL